MLWKDMDSGQRTRELAERNIHTPRSQGIRCLGLLDALFYCFDAICTGESAPRARRKGRQQDVRVNEYARAGHGAAFTAKTLLSSHARQTRCRAVRGRVVTFSQPFARIHDPCRWPHAAFARSWANRASALQTEPSVSANVPADRRLHRR